MHGASKARMLRTRGRRANSLLLARGRSKGLLLRKGFRDRAATIRAKARVNHPKVGDILRLLASQGRGHVSIATRLDTRNRIALRGRDPRVMGNLSPSHQWDVHKLSLFLPTPPWARGASISPNAMHRPILLHNQARWAKVWGEVEDRAHKLGLQGLRGVCKPLHLRLSFQISWLFRVHFYYLSYGQEYCLILVHLIHSLLHHV